MVVIFFYPRTPKITHYISNQILVYNLCHAQLFLSLKIVYNNINMFLLDFESYNLNIIIFNTILTIIKNNIKMLLVVSLRPCIIIFNTIFNGVHQFDLKYQTSDQMKTTNKIFNI